jgi:uncharacterized protein
VTQLPPLRNGTDLPLAGEGAARFGLLGVAKFFATTYGLSWICFVAAGRLSRPGLPANKPALLWSTLLMVGTFAPGIVGTWRTWLEEGAAGTARLFGRVLQWRVSVRWYILAIGYFLAIRLSVVVADRAIAGAWPSLQQIPWYVFLPGIVFSTPAQAGEEIGWRGYALPRLGARFGFARASLIVGVVWGAWHAPLFFVPGLDKTGQSVVLFAVGSIALSVAMTWVYVHAQRSVLLMMIMHAAVNETTIMIPSALLDASTRIVGVDSLAEVLTVAALSMCAAFFLLRMPNAPVEAAIN